MDDLEAVYIAADKVSALVTLDVFAKYWYKKYLKILLSWQKNWLNLSTHFKCLQEVRRLIYITNAIEGFNWQLRKATKSKTLFLTDEILFEMLYLAMMDITK